MGKGLEIKTIGVIKEITRLRKLIDEDHKES